MRTEIKVENSAILILVWMKCVLCGTGTLACARVESEGGRHRQGPHLRAAFARKGWMRPRLRTTLWLCGPQPPSAAHDALAVVRAIQQPKCRHLETFPACRECGETLRLIWASFGTGFANEQDAIKQSLPLDIER